MSELGVLRVDGLQYIRGYGYYAEESQLLTRFVVHVAVKVKHQPAEDSLSSVLNYETIVEQVDLVFSRDWKFIESIASAVHSNLSELTGVESVWVKVEKMKPVTLPCRKTAYELGSI
jgi:dihydroneopterin aldolase